MLFALRLLAGRLIGTLSWDSLPSYIVLPLSSMNIVPLDSFTKKNSFAESRLLMSSILKDNCFISSEKMLFETDKELLNATLLSSVLVKSDIGVISFVILSFVNGCTFPGEAERSVSSA